MKFAQYTVGLSRISKGISPPFLILVQSSAASAKLTPPFRLFLNGIDYANLENQKNIN
jgi:hypothetical protein